MENGRFPSVIFSYPSAPARFQCCTVLGIPPFFSIVKPRSISPQPLHQESPSSPVSPFYTPFGSSPWAAGTSRRPRASFYPRDFTSLTLPFPALPPASSFSFLPVTYLVLSGHPFFSDKELAPLIRVCTVAFFHSYVHQLCFHFQPLRLVLPSFAKFSLHTSPTVHGPSLNGLNYLLSPQRGCSPPAIFFFSDIQY